MKVSHINSFYNCKNMTSKVGFQVRNESHKTTESKDTFQPSFQGGVGKYMLGGLLLGSIAIGITSKDTLVNGVDGLHNILANKPELLAEEDTSEKNNNEEIKSVPSKTYAPSSILDYSSHKTLMGLVFYVNQDENKLKITNDNVDITLEFEQVKGSSGFIVSEYDSEESCISIIKGGKEYLLKAVEEDSLYHLISNNTVLQIGSHKGKNRVKVSFDKKGEMKNIVGFNCKKIIWSGSHKK